VTLLYEFLARLLGTKPIHVNLSADAFTFSSGETRVRLRPLVWLEHDAPTAPIVAIGNNSPPPGAIAVDLASSQVIRLPSSLRQRALEAVLFQGLKRLAHTGTIQRPEIIFHGDSVLAPAFDSHQRDALQQAASRARAFGIRFE
jgi:hypothetical protein